MAQNQKTPVLTFRGFSNKILGAGNEIRTRDPNLGKVYSRMMLPYSIGP